MTWRWFLSRTVREATYLRRRVARLRRAQADLIPDEGIEAIQQAEQQLADTVEQEKDRGRIRQSMVELEQVGAAWLQTHRHSGIRENIDVILVGLVIALAIRTFFLQPMAIPTGSMQPTLFGVTLENLRGHSGVQVPPFARRLYEYWAHGVKYYHVVARGPGRLTAIEAPRQILPLVRFQRFWIGQQRYTLWWPPKTLPAVAGVPPEQALFVHAGVRPDHRFQAGEEVLSLKVVSGDRLLVDRLTYNFRRPQRGEIVIFASTGIDGLTQHTHYIKRLVGLGGEVVQINDDRHVVVDGRELDASDPYFENLYTFGPVPREGRYSGHVNNRIARDLGLMLEGYFDDGESRFRVRKDHLFVLGDNTVNSYDSRYWGDFPEEKVIGRCWFVFWPVTERFGWGFR